MKIFYWCFLLLPQLLKGQEKIFYNAHIFTANYREPFAEAVAIKENKIVAVGSLAGIKKSVSANAELINLNGQYLLPGFVDSHIHAISGGRGLIKPNTMDKLLTIPELAVYARDELKSKDGLTGDVLVIYGLNIATWASLEEIIHTFNEGDFATQAVVLRGSDGHTAWVNNVMLKKAGIDKNFIQSLSGDQKNYFGVTASGESNGFVSESGYRKISTLLVGAVDMHRAAEKTMEYTNGYGITAWLDPSAGSSSSLSGETLDAYAWLISQHKLTAHVAATIVADADKDAKPQIEMVKALQKKYNRRNFSILGFKIFADGVIEHPTHTAALSLPYTGTSSRGVLMFDPEKFARFVIEADKQHMLVHVHAIGDRAVTKTLDGIEAARKANGNDRLPHTITHMQVVLPEDFARFKQLHVLSALQLLWAFGDITTIDIVKPYIAPELYQWQYPARSLLESGAIICGASDWPVSSANPFEAIYYAETRKGPMGVLDATQCMPRISMLYAYTIEAAKAMMLENQIGSLEPGKSADMILVDRDILTVDAESFKKTKLLWTMFEGKLVYEAKK